MEFLKIISEKHNPLFSRKEILVEIKKEASPKTSEAEALLSEKFSSSVDSIKITRILPKFGSNIFTIYAKIYKSNEDKDKIERKPKEKAAKPK